MLLRAGLIYVLSVMTMLLGGLAAWQHLDISLREQDSAALGKRITALEQDLDALRRREEAAVRRALVAEDSLSRNETYSTSDAVQLNAIKEQLAVAQREKAEVETVRVRLEADLAQAIKERDEIHVARDELRRAADEARSAAGRALQEADIARQEIVDLKKTSAAATQAALPQTVTPQTPTVSSEAAVTAPVTPQPQVPVANVTTSEVKVVPDDLVRPAAETPAVINSDTKATLTPSAVTIEPAPKADKKVETAPVVKRAAVKSEQRRSKPKTASAGSSAAKKTPKQAKKDEPFFPF